MSASSQSGGYSRPLRVIITNTSKFWGGTEHYAVQIAAGLARRGHAVRFLWGWPAVGERAEAAGRESGFVTQECRLRRDGDLIGFNRLLNACRRHRIDALLLTMWRDYFLGGIAARMAGVPLAVMSLGLYIEPKRDLKRRIVFGLADRIVVNAGEIRDNLVAHSWIDGRKLRVVLNGVDLRHYRPFASAEAAVEAVRLRGELGIPPEAPLVGTLGVLTVQKDHDLLIRAAADVIARRPEVHVVIVGEGDLRPALEARIAELGLADRVHLPGFRRDVRPVLAALDLFVLSSENEGMAWVLLEALACGLPILATDVSGTRACVVEGENGRIVPPRDREALAGALGAMLSDPDALRCMGRASRQLAEVRFDEERMISETEAVLRGG